MAITTTAANTATKHRERPDDDYEPVTSCSPLGSPPGGYVVPSPPPPSHPPLSPPPVATPTQGEEDVYESIEN